MSILCVENTPCKHTDIMMKIFNVKFIHTATNIFVQKINKELI